MQKPDKFNAPTKLALLGLYLATYLSQVAYPAYSAYIQGESVLALLLPSLLFVSLLTIPSLVVGAKLGSKVNLALVARNTNLKQSLLTTAVLGALLGSFLLILRSELLPYLPPELPEYGFRGPVGGLLVSIGAAIGEEVWFRYGLLTLCFFAYCRVNKVNEVPRAAGFSIVVLIAFLFGLAHLPQLLSYGANSTFAIWATILGNVAVGILYGWSFWRYGLFAAIFAHLWVDLVLHFFPAF